MKKLICLFTSGLLLAALPSCTNDEAGPSLVEPGNCNITGAMSYVNDIQPIVQRACVNSCHYAGSGNYDYSRYEVLADRIRSGRLEERLLMPVDEPLHMPQGGAMDPCNLYKLRLWISQGYKNN